jgi:hypothetical protein
LVRAYPSDETRGEEGTLSNVAAGDVRDTLDHFGERTVTAIWWPEITGRESLPSS